MTELTQEELDARPTRLTGSSTAGFLGEGHYAGPRETWLVHTGKQVFQGNSATEAGKDMEDGIANMVERELGIELRRETSVFHPDYPDMIVIHPDRLCDAESLGVQIKNHRPAVARYGIEKWKYKAAPQSAGRWDNLLVPDEYRIQCQLEMSTVAAAMGPEWGKCWILAAYFGGANLRCYWVKHDERLWQGILHKGIPFWKQHLDPNGPQTEPDDGNWRPPAKEPKRQKFTEAERANAPLPQYSTREDTHGNSNAT